MTRERAQYHLSEINRHPDYFDKKTYEDKKKEFGKLIDAAKQSPKNADLPLSSLYWMTFGGGVGVSQVATPQKAASTAAALEAYIAILDLQNPPSAPPQTQREEPKKEQPKNMANPTPFMDPRAEVAAHRIVQDATKGTNIDASAFIPGLPSAGPSTITGVGTDTNTNTNTNTTTNTGTRLGPSTSIKSPNSNSTITGKNLSSAYKPITASGAKGIVDKYKSVPGGLTLEGGSPDLSAIRTAGYVGKANAFIFNDDLVYLNPVKPQEFAEIARALAADDRLGVSIGVEKSIVYGGMPLKGAVATRLRVADMYLGAIAFGNRGLLRGYRFAPGYQALRSQTVANVSVYFNLHDFRFSEDPTGELVRTTSSLDSTLVPTLTAEDPSTPLPDYKLIEKGDFPPEFLTNLRHFHDNITYYGRERIMRDIVGYGEAAAMARALRDNGLKLEGLADSVSGAR
jgi:hypothetical protein